MNTQYETQQYPIVCAIDNNYTQHCAVMLCSLFEHNTKLKFHIYILTESLSDYNIQALKTFIKKYNQKCEIKILDTSSLQNVPTSHHISKASYFRILIPSVIPEHIHRILFLDADLVIRRNILDLINFDISDYALGVAIDPQGKFRKPELDIPLEKDYFNAGILVMNLKKWRKEKIAQRIFTYIDNNHQKLRYHDQDALNANLYNDVVFFPSTWNLVEDFFRFSSTELNLSEQQHKILIKNPAIIHFTSARKPWHLENKHPFKKEYKYYLAKTPWKNYSYTKDYFKRKWQRMVKLIDKYLLNKLHSE